MGDDLTILAKDGMSEHLSEVWPTLCQKSGVKIFPMPPPDKVLAMWPFLAVAVRSYGCVEPARTLERLRHGMAHWPSQAYAQLPSTGKADERARDFIATKLRENGIQPVWDLLASLSGAGRP